MTTITCFGAQIWVAGFESGLQTLVSHAKSERSGYACFANAHMVGEAARNPALAQAMGEANWVFPDGRPVATFVRWLGARTAEQIPGPEMTERLLHAAAESGLSVYFYGGTQEVLDRLVEVCATRFPSLKIAGYFSPPFRARTEIDIREDVDRIRMADARICFVALGCPKQEIWMHKHHRMTGTVCLGVGAAFPMISGETPRAPAWARRYGLEWVYRWMQEPRRLTTRYTLGNYRFGIQMIKEVARDRTRSY